MKKLCLLVLTVWCVVYPELGFSASIKGKIVRGDDLTPIENAYSNIYIWNETDQYWNYIGWAPTNDKGIFILNDLIAGTYIAWIHPGYTAFNKYIPEYYNNIPEWSFDNATKISIENDSDNIQLRPAKLSKRPYYIDTMTYTNSIPSTGGTVNVMATVINSTQKETKMDFWIIGYHNRQTSNAYYNLFSEFPLTDRQSFELKPGSNTINLSFDVSASHETGYTSYNVFGGGSYSKAMLAAMSGDFYKESSAASPAATFTERLASPIQEEMKSIIPLKISPTGEVLQRGTRPSK